MRPTAVLVSILFANLASSISIASSSRVWSTSSWLLVADLSRGWISTVKCTTQIRSARGALLWSWIARATFPPFRQEVVSAHNSLLWVRLRSLTHSRADIGVHLLVHLMLILVVELVTTWKRRITALSTQSYIVCSWCSSLVQMLCRTQLLKRLHLIL